LAESETALNHRYSFVGNTNSIRFRSLFFIALCFGILSGLIEGCGLILFQRLNWQGWGAMLHVSAPIVWVSPLVDVTLFVALASLIGVIAKLLRRLPGFAVLIFLLSFLAAYDWLTLTARLYRWSCLLLALGIASVFTRWGVRNQACVVKFSRRTLPLLITILFALFVLVEWSPRWKEQRATRALPSPAPDSPNVVVVVIDTLRADHVHAYGYSRETTPSLDELASQGVLFENAISPTPWSLPSHASLLTGRYQFEHGIEDIPPMSIRGLMQPPMNGFTTIGEVLEKHGYRTAAFSANRVNFTADLGFRRGFLHFEDYFQNPSDAFIRTLYGREFSRIYLNRTEHSKIKRLLRWLGFNSLLDKSDEGSIRQIGALGVQKRADAVNQELLNWIDKGHRRARPFFGFLNYIDVHHPYGGPTWFDKPWKGNDAVDQYDSGIRYADECLGRLREELRKRGLDRNTLLVITSDHGESLGEHNIAFHGESLYREQVRAPLVFWFPTRIPSGVRIPALVSNASIAATLVSVLNLPRENDFRQPPIDDLWKGSRVNSTDSVVSEVAQLYPASDEDIASQKVVPVSMDGPMKSLITADWQLITHAKFGSQLFRYATDPGETRDLFHSPESQDKAGDLLLRLQNAISGSAALTQAVRVGDGAHTFESGKSYRTDALAGSVLQMRLSNSSSNQKPLTAESAEGPQSSLRSALSKFVITIVDKKAKVFQSCRNYDDDNIPKPGIADPTPREFDDLCVDPIASNGSRLEILVPGARGTPVELYLRVSDWDGKAVPGGFRLILTRAGASN
jgi:arylsulfatase A-like enzyme